VDARGAALTFYAGLVEPEAQHRAYRLTAEKLGQAYAPSIGMGVWCIGELLLHSPIWTARKTARGFFLTGCGEARTDIPSIVSCAGPSAFRRSTCRSTDDQPNRLARYIPAKHPAL